MTNVLDRKNILSESTLIEPHGGKLVDRVLGALPNVMNRCFRIPLSKELQMDVEQLAIGTFSPLEGFLNEVDFHSVLDHMRLDSGIVWPLPIILDITEEQSSSVFKDDNIILTNDKNETLAILHVEDKYRFDKTDLSKKMYGTNDSQHPGVQHIKTLHPILLGGKINLIKKRTPEFKDYELSPREVRRRFKENNWKRVVGFHTRNVIHRGHEYIQLQALEKSNCDGLFIHPVIGKKKSGDFEAKCIVKTYERMMSGIYPENRVLLGLFSTYSRYAGPREALFTALCRQNYGCSHFVVGRDHTGVGDYYHPHASHQIFDEYPEIAITPIIFDKVFYSNKLKRYVCSNEQKISEDSETQVLSGTRVRKLFQSSQAPPDWFMRREISDIILHMMEFETNVFVP